MQKIKDIGKRFIKKDSLLYKLMSKTYHLLGKQKYKLTHSKKIKIEKKRYMQIVDEATRIIDGYSNSNYIVFYNPSWLGVAASTKGLFKNNVPLEQVFGKKNIKKISDAVVKSNVNTVIFSQIVDGWIQIIETIKKNKPEVNVKVIWHGNCYEFFSDYTWNLNKEVLRLHNENIINCLGFVRSTMFQFYKAVGYNSYYLQNNVHKENCGKTVINKNESIKVGIYNADTRELKNIYTALSAISLLENAIADVVPINQGALEFTKILNLKTESIDKYIKNEELMERIQENDINIYPTFTENAPMFPLESFEMGIPCLLGNNNDYFVGTELGKYVILEKEDDPLYVKEKILIALENREKIMELYRSWKIDFDQRCEEYVQEFINA